MLTIRTNPLIAPARTPSPVMEMDRLFESFLAPFWGAQESVGARTFPLMNVWQDDESFHVEAELPGFRPEDLDISVEGDELTIRGSREGGETTQDGQVIRAERFRGSFERSIRLPVRLDGDKVTAELTNGVLTVHLPKPAEAMARKIRITG
jgi:HSP20 family protein